MQISIPLLNIILSSILVSVFSTTPSLAGVACGNVIGPNKVAYLKKDLVCAPSDIGGNPAALTVLANSILILGDHSVTCAGIDVGIQMNESGSAIKNGTVTDCDEAAVKVTGTGRHTISKVTARSNTGIGFLVTEGSNGNQLLHNAALDGGDNGFTIESDDNRLKNNTSRNQSGAGYEVDEGNRNILKYNLADINATQGFMLTGNENTIMKNRATSNIQNAGFVVEGDRNRFIGNLAKKNGIGTSDAGIVLQGTDVEVIWNKVTGGTNDGIEVLGDSSRFKIVGNIALRNGRFGIIMDIGARDSTLLGNIALNNGPIDLVDEHPDCDNNKWKGNIGSRIQECIR